MKFNHPNDWFTEPSQPQSNVNNKNKGKRITLTVSDVSFILAYFALSRCFHTVF